MGFKTKYGISVSKGESDLILSAGLLRRRSLIIIENGVALPALRKKEPRDKYLRIIAVNRYDEQKNPELLIDIALLLKGNLPFRINVIGVGERFSSCKKKIKELQLDDVISLDGPTDMPREKFRDANVFLSTSRWEGMPLAVLEAMSEGLPVVLSDVVGNRDIVKDNVSGLLYDVEDATAAADAIKKLNCPSFRRRLGEGARLRVEERYSDQRMFEETAELYRKVVRG
jgi:glycosyltransferase involved in cell wall biosynthesis